MNRLRAFWLPATHPLTSPSTLETAKQHALGGAGWGYSAVGIVAAEVTMPGKWPIVGLLFLGLLGLMTIELCAGYATLPAAERRVFQWSTEIVGKILLVSLVAVSIILDGVILLTATVVDFSYVPVMRSGWPFVTCTTLLWLIIAQFAAAVEHVRAAEGPESIPPTMGFVVRQIRAMLRALSREDRARFRQAHPGEEPPARWHHDLTDDEIALILAVAKENPEAVPSEVLRKLRLEHPVTDPVPRDLPEAQ